MRKHDSVFMKERKRPVIAVTDTGIGQDISYRKDVMEIEHILKALGEQGKCVAASVKSGRNSSYPAESRYYIGVLGSEKLLAGEFSPAQKRNYMITARAGRVY